MFVVVFVMGLVKIMVLVFVCGVRKLNKIGKKCFRGMWTLWILLERCTDHVCDGLLVI